MSAWRVMVASTFDLIKFDIPLQNVRFTSAGIAYVRRELAQERLPVSGGVAELLAWYWSPAPRPLKKLDHWQKRHRRPVHHAWVVRRFVSYQGLSGPARIIRYTLQRSKAGDWRVGGTFENNFRGDDMGCPLEFLDRAPLVFNANWRQMLRAAVGSRTLMTRQEAGQHHTNIWSPRRFQDG